ASSDRTGRHRPRRRRGVRPGPAVRALPRADHRGPGGGPGAGRLGRLGALPLDGALPQRPAALDRAGQLRAGDPDRGLRAGQGRLRGVHRDLAGGAGRHRQRGHLRLRVRPRHPDAGLDPRPGGQVRPAQQHPADPAGAAGRRARAGHRGRGEGGGPGV
ncbi:MAG: hypothetical protein AVDCRST_MAG41-1330, partial [uncultured Corynebacteriales bacterium]